MANAKCRKCERAADAGAYCSSCAADIMAKALNPSFCGRWKKSPRPDPPLPQLNSVSSGNSARMPCAPRSRKKPENFLRPLLLPCAIKPVIAH